MSQAAIEYQADRKRLEQSLLISLLFWLFFIGILAFVPIRSVQVPETTMNPVYVELAPLPEAPPETEPSPVAGSRRIGSAVERPAATAVAAAPASSPAQASAPVQAPTPAAASAPVQAPPPAEAAAAASAPAAAAPPSTVNRPQPARPASRTAAPSSPYQGRGGEDPFAPLSEEDLAAITPDAPALPAGPASAPVAGPGSTRTGVQRTSGTPTDALAQRVQSTTEDLEKRGSSVTAAGPAQGTGTGHATTKAARDAGSGGSAVAAGSGTRGGTGGGTATGSLVGSLDFGDSPGRRLISAPETPIPAKLLEGQPLLLETVVRFRIDKGGTVIALSIQFDPPLPLDIAEYLKTYVFSRWVFSPSNTDGQVRFKYSIKVQ